MRGPQCTTYPDGIGHAPWGDCEEAENVLWVLGTILLQLKARDHQVCGGADEGGGASQHCGKGHGDQELLGADAAPAAAAEERNIQRHSSFVSLSQCADSHSLQQANGEQADQHTQCCRSHPQNATSNHQHEQILPQRRLRTPPSLACTSIPPPPTNQRLTSCPRRSGWGSSELHKTGRQVRSAFKGRCSTSPEAPLVLG